VTPNRREWALLAYRLPREPSTPRITLWRKLRRIGAVQVVDGLVALPASPRTREQLDWLADEVLEAGGEAWTWAARSGSRQQDLALEAELTDVAAEDYRSLLTEIEALAGGETVTRRTVARLRRALHRIELRDHASPPEREHARRAVERLATLVAGDAEAVPR
jgi:hypothetical protein